MGDSVPNSLVDDVPSNSPSSQTIGTTPPQLQEPSPSPAMLLANRAVPTQKLSDRKRPAGPPLPNAQPAWKRRKQQPQDNTLRAGMLLPPTAPPVDRVFNRQMSGVKRPAPVLQRDTQPYLKRQRQQPQNGAPYVELLRPPNVPPLDIIHDQEISGVNGASPVLPGNTHPQKKPIEEALRKNAIIRENREKAQILQEAIQQGQFLTAAVQSPLPLPLPTNNTPITTYGSEVPIIHPPNPNTPSPLRRNLDVSNTAIEQEKLRRHRAARRKEQLRRKALLAKNRAEAYPEQVDPPQQDTTTPTTAGP